MHRTRLCFVVDDLERCGSTALLHAWLGQVAWHQRWQCHVVALGAAGPMAIDLQSAGAAVHALDAGSSGSALLAGLRLHSLLQRLKPDCVHAVGATSVFVAAAAARLARVRRVVLTPRGEMTTPGALRLLLGAAVRSADVITADSPAAAERICARHRVHPVRVSVLPPAVAPHRCADQQALPVLHGEPRVVMLGRFHDDENLDWLVECVKLLRTVHPRVCVSAFGTGLAARRLTSAAQREQLGEHLQCLGTTDDPAGVLLAADVLLSPRRTEHALLAPLEALALGTPVVALESPSLTGLLESGRHALIVPAGNAALVADALDRVLTDSALRESLRQQGREFAHQSMPAAVAVDQLARLYSTGLEEAASFAV